MWGLATAAVSSAFCILCDIGFSFRHWLHRTQLIKGCDRTPYGVLDMKVGKHGNEKGLWTHNHNKLTQNQMCNKSKVILTAAWVEWLPGSLGIQIGTRYVSLTQCQQMLPQNEDLSMVWIAVFTVHVKFSVLKKCRISPGGGGAGL